MAVENLHDLSDVQTICFTILGIAILAFWYLIYRD